MWKWLFLALFVPAFLTYAIQHMICAFFYKTQNLKKRYGAEWALVTGASSGVERQRGRCRRNPWAREEKAGPLRGLVRPL